jgi:hypothetical protein
VTPDTALILNELNEKKICRLEGRTYNISAFEMPAASRLEGIGQGITVLNVVEGEGGIRVKRDTGTGVTTLRDFTLTTSAFRKYGIHISAPVLFRGNRGHAAEVNMDHLEVRAGDGIHAFERGVVVENISDARLYDVRVTGRFQDITAESLGEPEAMDVAFDLRGSQEAKLIGCYSHGSRTAVYGNVPTAGSGEGHAVAFSALINTQIGVKMEGQPAGVNGGFNTPWLTVAHSHIFYLNAGVLASNYHDVHISDNSFCVSHFNKSDQWKIGVYTVADANVMVSGNTFWATKPGMSIGVLGDRTINSSVFGNVMDPSTQMGFYLPGSQYWTDKNVLPVSQPIVAQAQAHSISK